MPQSDGLYFAPGPEPNHLRLSMAINLSWLLPSKHPLVGVAYRFSPLCVQKMLVTGLVLVRQFSVREPDRKWWTKNIGLDFSSRLRDEPQRDGGPRAAGLELRRRTRETQSRLDGLGLLS